MPKYTIEVLAVFRYSRIFEIECQYGYDAEKIAIRDMQELSEDEVMSKGKWDFYGITEGDF